MSRSVKMDEKELKKFIGNEEKLGCPVNLLTDVGNYCYTALTSVALNMLYSDTEDSYNKHFIEKTVKSLGNHLKQPRQVVDSALSVAQSVEIQNYQPFIESLKTEDIIKTEGVALLSKDLVLVGLQEGCYDARMRTLVKFVSLMLQVDWDQVEEYENLVIETFKEEEHVATEEEKKEKASKEKVRKIKKFALIGAATVGGGVLVGLTGGLAAPLIAAGAGAVIGTAGAAALGSTAGVAIIGSLFGVAGAGLGGYKMNKRVGDVEEFSFEPLTEGNQLHVTIAITGWISDEYPDFAHAWRGLDNSKEQYVLRYESKYLKEMGSAMDYLVKIAVSQATTEALKYTVLASLMAAIVWPATIIAAAGVIDNPWSVLTNRTQQAGKMLAEVLLSRQQGRRPVTLIGFSLGARVVFYCLQEMAKRKNCEGIVEDAVMLGTPASATPRDWEKMSRVVAGKIVNGYCKGDWLLKFLYRTASVQFEIAGLQPIKWNNRRMHNVDLSEIVEGHMDYMNKLDMILEIIGIKVKPHATSSDSHQSLKQWVTANKTRGQNTPGVTTASDAKGEGSGSVEVEVAEDACLLDEKSTAEDGLNEKAVEGDRGKNPEEGDQNENSSNDVQRDSNESNTKVEEYVSHLIDSLIINAVQEANNKPTQPVSGDSSGDLVSELAAIGSLPSADSGLGTSEIQDEEESTEPC